MNYLQITLKNFGLIKQTDIIVPENGITVIAGEDESVTGKLFELIHGFNVVKTPYAKKDQAIIRNKFESTNDHFPANKIPLTEFIVSYHGPGNDGTVVYSCSVERKTKIKKLFYLAHNPFNKQNFFTIYNPETNLHPKSQRREVLNLGEELAKESKKGKKYKDYFVIFTNSPTVVQALLEIGRNGPLTEDKIKFYFCTPKKILDVSQDIGPLWTSLSGPMLQSIK